MEPLEKTLFYKPTGTVQIANKFSLIERKLINAIVWHSQKRKFQPVEHAIPVRDVFHLIGLDSSRNNEVLKEALRTLASTVIEWNRFGEDKVQEWGVCTFLASGVIRAGKLFYLLNPKLIEQINQPTLYAKIQLLVQSQVRKRHALVLYEFLLDALSRTRKDSLRVVVPLERLYELLGVNKATSYKFFNRDAIKPSVQEIAKHTDLSVTYYTHREGRQVAELVFVVEKKAKFQRYLDFDTERLDHTERFEEARAASGGSDLQSLLEDYGVGNRKAKELIATYEEDRIRGNIEHLVGQQQDKRRIRNPAAYLVKAIEEDYRPKPSAQEREADKAQAAKMRATQAQQAQERLREEWKRFLQQRVKARFAEQSTEWQEEKRRRFVAQIEGEGKGSLLRSAYKKQGLNSAMIQAVFFSGLREELLTLPEETDFDKYLEYKVNSENA